MTAADTVQVTNEQAGRDKSLLTSHSESYLEKLSPGPASIPNSPAASIHSNKPKPEDEANIDDSANVSDDETKYPPNITKVAVGVGLALAVLLVIYLHLFT